MGGHKKHKGQQSQSSSRKNQQLHPTHKPQHTKQLKPDTQAPTASQAGTEDSPNLLTFFRSSKMMLWIAVMAMFGLGAVFARSSFIASLKPNFQASSDEFVVNARRVTTLDDDIMSGNVLLHGSDHETLPVIQESQNVQQNFDAELRKRTVLPTLCKDGVTMGFSDWGTLKAAVQEANALSAERFLRWNEHYASVAEGQNVVLSDSSLYYEEDVVLTICPGATLKSRKGPIYINAENIILECEYCVVDVRGTHLAFGPHAKNVLVRGITFRGAHTASLTFYHDGAEASFEDIFWTGNVGNGKIGAVADVNSTSTVSFYRCEIADTKYVPRVGQGRGGQSGGASSLTIRSS